MANSVVVGFYVLCVGRFLMSGIWANVCIYIYIHAFQYLCLLAVEGGAGAFESKLVVFAVF